LQLFISPVIAFCSAPLFVDAHAFADGVPGAGADLCRQVHVITSEPARESIVGQISEMPFTPLRATLKYYIGKPAQRLKLRRPQAG